MPGQSRERRQAFARYNSSREPLVVPHGLSVRLGCRAHQEYLLVLAVQALGGKTRQEKIHDGGGAYHHRHWLSLAEEPEQLRGSWRKLFRSPPLRGSQAVLGEAAPPTRAPGNSRADGSCLTHGFPQLFSREKAGLRRDAVRSQVLTCLKAQINQRRPAMKKVSTAATKRSRNIEDPDRFRKSRAVGCYLGLQPGRRKSGQSEPQLHISKEGDPYLRTLLVQGAQHILGPFGIDCDLRRGG